MSIKIDGDRATELLEAAVRERGEDYVYYPQERYVDGSRDESCAYVHFYGENEEVLEPGCGVGLALVNAGIEINAFIELDINTQCSAREAVNRLTESGRIECDLEAMEVFTSFQNNQDGRVPWGKSLERAKRVREGYKNSLANRKANLGL